MSTSEYFIGLMSGTSLDGVDGALVEFDASGRLLRVHAHVARDLEAGLREELLALNRPGPNELHRAAVASNELALRYAEVALALQQRADGLGLPRDRLQAIGAHGQTVRHQPPAPGQDPTRAYTLQLINPALLAERTGLPVVADFRSRDLAAGGQGAPLVPAFHRQVFGQAGVARAVLNLGGIANLSVLPADAADPASGLDCGPGNVLLDAWCRRGLQRPYDDQGQWAAGGRCLPKLLAALLDEPYFGWPAPKSTGRDLFHLDWLQARLTGLAPLSAQDVQTTLTELTAMTCAECVRRHAACARELIVCGGGAYNRFLLSRLRDHLPGVRVSLSGEHGLPPLQVEAAAFAWLARQAWHRAPGNLPSVTGASGLRVLGAIYPA